MKNVQTLNDGSPKQMVEYTGAQDANTIELTIVAGLTEATSSAAFSGPISHVITSAEADSFGIGTEDSIKNAINAHLGGSCDDAWIENPTGTYNLYDTYGWQQVTVTYTPLYALVTGVSTLPIEVANTVYQNGSNQQLTANVLLEYEAENVVDSNWNDTQGLEAIQAIEYDISILGGGGQGAASFSFTDSFGTGSPYTEPVSMTSGGGVAVPLPANSQFSAWIGLQQGTMTIEVTYIVFLSGCMTANYGKAYNGHHFWAPDVNECLSSVNQATTYQMTQTITIDFFTQGTVVIGTIKPYSPDVQEGVKVVNVAGT